LNYQAEFTSQITQAAQNSGFNKSLHFGLNNPVAVTQVDSLTMKNQNQTNFSFKSFARNLKPDFIHSGCQPKC
jgi:hypothetical protein